MTSTPPVGNQMVTFKRIVRECTAVILWTYVLLKLVVFDLDIYLLDRFAPKWRWILDLKAFILLGAMAFVWVTLGCGAPLPTSQHTRQ
jgi:hypothetical protein